jgi:hypothetical protein
VDDLMIALARDPDRLGTIHGANIYQYTAANQLLVDSSGL